MKELFVEHIFTVDNHKVASLETFGELVAKTAPGTELPQEALLTFLHKHKIREFYLGFVKTLIELTKDSLDFFRKFAMDILVEIAIHRDDFQDLILQTVINKMGDSEKKVQTHAIFVLVNYIKAKRD